MKIKINKFYFWWKGEIKKNNKFKKKKNEDHIVKIIYNKLRLKDENENKSNFTKGSGTKIRNKKRTKV
jgi:hypothetical protein